MRSLLVFSAMAAAAIASPVLAQGDSWNQPSPMVSREAEQRGDVVRDSVGNVYEIRRNEHGDVREIRRMDNSPPDLAPPDGRRYWGRGFPLRPGAYLPREYQGRGEVRNWRRNGLPAPARDQQWVQIDRDVVLVDRNTGLIRQVVPRR